MATKYYDVMHVNGDTYEVEAEFFQREGDDWVFYADDAEVFRVPFVDVLGVSKTPSWVRKDDEQSSEKLWL
jgi:hypothetical protein